MATITSRYKGYGFINYIDRWDPEVDGAFIRRTTALPAPTEQSRISLNNPNYSKSIYHVNLQNGGTRRQVSYFTAHKDTEFRTLMNTKFKDVQGDSNRYMSHITLGALYNKVDDDFGTSIATHGEYTMGDLFDFNGDEYKATYNLNYDFHTREQRLKDIGLVSSNNEMVQVFTTMVPAYPMDTRFTHTSGRALCCNFIPSNVGTYADLLSWNHKAYYIFDATQSLTINKLGTDDLIVPLNDFVLEGIDGGADVTAEYGRPMQLVSSSRTVNAGMTGLLLHVYK